MWFRTLFDSLKLEHSRTPVRQTWRSPPRRRPAAYRLAFDALEDRLVPASLTVSDATLLEGNAGTQNALVTVRLSAASKSPVTVVYSTADGAALAGSDYQAVSGKLTFAKGETSKSILVPVIGDTLGEPDETFFINLQSPKNATIADGQGVITIVDDDPRTISINDVSRSEGNAGTTPVTFTVTLSAAYRAPVSVIFATQDGTAVVGEDYLATSGTLTFALGETSKIITVEVIGDLTLEPDETLFVTLSGATNALIADGQGVATIVDDEPINWDGGGGDFNWNNRFNWSGDMLPSPVNDVVIGAAFSGITINYGSGTTSIHSLDSRANLALSGGSLTLLAASSINGDLTVSSGYLNVAGPLTVTGQFTNSGSVTVSGNITVYGDYTQTADGYLEVQVNWLGASLDIHGGARLDGTLHNVFADLQPAAVLTCYWRSGDFAVIDSYGTYRWEENTLYVWVDIQGGW